jgi:hypothetical protein
MLLVLEHLYMILPSYLQKGEPIVFSCQFGQVVTKSVEITNPSKHQLTYVAKVEGCRAYSIEGESEFLIDSKKTHEVKIRYVSNINLSNSAATLTLTGKASAKYTPSTFVFVLKSHNLGRISEKAVQVTANLYEQLDFNLKVTNNFAEDGDFKVEMVGSSKSGYSAFYLPSSNVKVKKGETVSLGMIFIPFTLETQQVLLVFRDERVGEFQYEVSGVVESNILCQEVLRVPQTLFTNKKYTIELTIPSRNDLIYRARKAAEFLADRLEKRAPAKDPKQPAPTPVVNYGKYYPKLTNLETFTARLSTPNNSIVLKSPEVVIRDIEGGEDINKRDEQKLAFEITMKAAIKEGTFTVNLRNTAGTDIRKYKVTLNAVSRPLRYELEMKTPANRPLQQPLPLINLSQERSLFHVMLLPANDPSRAVFAIDCEREVSVEAHEQGIINLSFRPKQQCLYNALLKVENVTSGQHVEYEIVGVSEEPETETIYYEQEVRKEKSYAIKLPVTKLTRCVVQNFAIDNVQYLKTFQCSQEQPYFRFRFLPKMSGKVEGQLLIEADQNIYAFKVQITVTNTIEGEIKMRTIERKEATAVVTLPPGEYRVVCADLNLKYPPSATITEEEPDLAISYYSSKPEEKEIYFTVVSDSLGELTYLLKVIVDPMPEIKLEPFQVELGKAHRETAVFENTDELDMTVTCKSSHPSIFFPEH